MGIVRLSKLLLVMAMALLASHVSFGICMKMLDFDTPISSNPDLDATGFFRMGASSRATDATILF
jgi:hypothetical protein